jgi:hypothetical protein
MPLMPLCLPDATMLPPAFAIFFFRCAAPRYATMPFSDADMPIAMSPRRCRADITRHYDALMRRRASHAHIRRRATPFVFDVCRCPRTS